MCLYGHTKCTHVEHTFNLRKHWDSKQKRKVEIDTLLHLKKEEEIGIEEIHLHINEDQKLIRYSTTKY